MDREVEMDAMAARVEMARRYEDVADGMQAARLLRRAVRAHVPAWLSGLPEGIAEWVAGRGEWVASGQPGLTSAA